LAALEGPETVHTPDGTIKASPLVSTSLMKFLLSVLLGPSAARLIELPSILVLAASPPIPMPPAKRLTTSRTRQAGGTAFVAY